MPEQELADAVALMDREHRDILAMFEDYAALMAAKAPAAARKTLADEICMAITIHTRLENEILYPLTGQAAAEDGPLYQAEAGHAVIREQIARLLGEQPAHPGYDQEVLALGQGVGRHVAEERQHLFPAVRLSGADLRQLALRLRERRLELQTVSEALREVAMLPAYA